MSQGNPTWSNFLLGCVEIVVIFKYTTQQAGLYCSVRVEAVPSGSHYNGENTQTLITRCSIIYYMMQPVPCQSYI